jgi:YHS domain-containing protein
MEKTEVDEKSNTIKFVYKGKTYELNNNPLSKAFKLLNKFSSMKM